MEPIWITLLVVVALSFLAELTGYRKVIFTGNPTSSFETRPHKLCFYLALSTLVVISGLRSGIGDTGFYMYSYAHVTVHDLFSQRDWGFTALQFLLKLVSSSPQFLIFFASLVTISLILKTLYSYARPFTLAVFLFVTSGVYITYMNGLRQCLVAAIILAATGWLIKGYKWRYFGLILVLATIHASVLVFIPVYFIVRRDAWSRGNLAIWIFLIATLVIFHGVFTDFADILNRTQYANYSSTFGTNTYSGENPLRVAVQAVPVFLAVFYRKKLMVKLKNFNIFVNFSVLNLLVNMFGLYNWIFARLGIYFGLYNLILLPLIIKMSYSRESKPIMFWLVVACYGVFFVYDSRLVVYSSYFLDINRSLIGPLTASMY